MKKIYPICLIVFSIVFYSCQTVTLMPIDYLVPSDVSFPSQIKRVGIVNNVSESAGRITENAELDSILLKQSNGFMERYTLNGDPQVATEALAEAVAGANYFDEVVICDSALQASHTSKELHLIDREDVNQLITELDVDMLIALEQIQVKVQRQTYSMGELGYIGTVDAKVYPKVNLYIAKRNGPLIIINGNDSVFWEEMASTRENARKKVVPDEQLIAEASEFAGSIPLKYMLPYWETGDRFFYTSGSSEMRDAAFFVQSDEWDKALPLWEKVYASQKGKKKAQAASNISLYYEIKDDMDKAQEWGNRALEQMRIAEKIESDVKVENMSINYARIYFNQRSLTERKNNFSKLKMQMDRFENDFQSESFD